MKSELVPTEPSQTYPTASVRGLPIIEKRPTNLLVGLFLLLAHFGHSNLLQCIAKFIIIHKNVGKSVGKMILI